MNFEQWLSVRYKKYRWINLIRCSVTGANKR